MINEWKGGWAFDKVAQDSPNMREYNYILGLGKTRYNVMVIKPSTVIPMRIRPLTPDPIEPQVLSEILQDIIVREKETL